MGGGTGCAQGLDPATETGLAELVLLTRDDVVLQLRVDAKAPLDEQPRACWAARARAHAQQAW